MKSSAPHLAVSGSAMDKIVPKRRLNRIAIGGVVALVVLGAGFGLWRAMPHGLQVFGANLDY